MQAKRSALQIRLEELNFHSERYKMLLTQCSFVAGFTFESIVHLDLHGAKGSAFISQEARRFFRAASAAEEASLLGSPVLSPRLRSGGGGPGLLRAGSMQRVSKAVPGAASLAAKSPRTTTQTPPWQPKHTGDAAAGLEHLFVSSPDDSAYYEGFVEGGARSLDARIADHPGWITAD